MGRAVRRFRITLVGLMGLILASACGLAVLRYASPFWFEVVAGLTLFVFLTAAVGAIQGGHRAAWLGFAVFGWGSAIVAFAFALHDAVSNQPATVRSIPTHTMPRTPLTDLLDTLYPTVHYAPPAGAVNGVQIQAIRSGVVYASFHWIGHDLACLVCACIGAVVAAILRSSREAHP
jgi:hypothetical protein